VLASLCNTTQVSSTLTRPRSPLFPAMSLSTAIKNSVTQSTNQKASQAASELARLKALSDVSGTQFSETYLSGSFQPNKHASGLMSVNYHGYELDFSQKRAETATLDARTTRVKICMATGDVGQPLKSITSLHQFLCVMYDACVGESPTHSDIRFVHTDSS
jgi:hypothetical protein